MIGCVLRAIVGARRREEHEPSARRRLSSETVGFYAPSDHVCRAPDCPRGVDFVDTNGLLSLFLFSSSVSIALAVGSQRKLGLLSKRPGPMRTLRSISMSGMGRFSIQGFGGESGCTLGRKAVAASSASGGQRTKDIFGAACSPYVSSTDQHPTQEQVVTC